MKIGCGPLTAWCSLSANKVDSRALVWFDSFTEIQELEAMKARVREMEAEAAKLREMQAVVHWQTFANLDSQAYSNVSWRGYFCVGRKGNGSLTWRRHDTYRARASYRHRRNWRTKSSTP